MSLLCCAYTVDPATGQMDKDLGDWPVGGEHWRTTFYGAPIMEAIGVRLLPSLRSGDIFASGAKLAQLEADVSLILSQWDAVASALFRDDENGWKEKETTALRLSYIQRAIALAKEHNGMVVIW